MSTIKRTNVVPGTEPPLFSNAGPPSSGTSGTFAGEASHNALCFDRTNHVLYVNEGTAASPYWTPVSYDQAGIFGYWSDFRDGAGKALANTDAAATLIGSGLRIHGQGVAETDSGGVVASGEGGGLLTLTATNEDAHVIALSTPAGVFQPDQHSLLVLDAELSMNTAITLRAFFAGFLGTLADALDPPVTGATTTATLVQDDLAGLFFDVGLTDGDRLYGVHNKSNEAATQDLTADGDTSTDIAAAGTFQRFRVEISSAGVMTAFVDKAQVYTQSAALDADEECGATLALESTSAATKAFDVRRFAAWATR